jgi:hypothetical protein
MVGQEWKGHDWSRIEEERKEGRKEGWKGRTEGTDGRDGRTDGRKEGRRDGRTEGTDGRDGRKGGIKEGRIIVNSHLEIFRRGRRDKRRRAVVREVLHRYRSSRPKGHLRLVIGP